jgi:hypothetical protein
MQSGGGGSIEIKQQGPFHAGSAAPFMLCSFHQQRELGVFLEQSEFQNFTVVRSPAANALASGLSLTGLGNPLCGLIMN